MKSRILHSSYIIDFLDIGFNSDQISSILKSEADKTLENISSDNLSDWEVQFRAVYGQGTAIRLYKSLASYIKDKQKLITAHIPIPQKNIVEWGVTPTQYISVGKHSKEDKNVSILSVNFESFENRTDYILDCLRRTIKFCFEDGFTVNGVKMKITS